MFWQKHPVAALTFATFFLTSCGDDSKTADNSINGSDEGIVAITDKTISGVSQKGPFVNGSSVTVQELDGETLAQTGGSFEGKIKNDLGEFSVKVKKLESQYALLKATGFYRNEVTGNKSKSQVTLYALTDLSNRDEVNVNLLTHLAYERTLYLATEEGHSVAEAKKQAEAEVLKSFGIEGDFAAAEDLNIFGESDQNAALLAISILMQGELSEGDFSERLANYAADIETDGIWNDSKTANKIADWANAQWLGSGLTKIREKIAKWELSADVPMFEKYVNNYWWQKYGLGTCESKREGEVLKNQNAASVKANEYYICKSGAWEIASDIEKDTYMWLDPTAKRTEKDGDVRYGDVTKTNCYVFEDKAWRSGNANDCSLNLRGCTSLRQDTVGLGSDSVWYICDTKSWRKAKALEYDTYGWADGKDGDSKLGSVSTKNCYVFENNAWRIGNSSDCSLNLRGCTSLRQDTVGKGSDKAWYICDAKTWRNATTYEKDTFGWKDSTDGVIKKGNVTDSVYVFDKTAWRIASQVEAKFGACIADIVDSVGNVGSTYYICKSDGWTTATVIEYDTYGWSTGKDGDSKAGKVNANNCYVYESNAWRSGNSNDCSLGLRGCTTLRQDTVGLGSDNTWYICENKIWRNATSIEINTYGWACLDSNEGEMKIGLKQKTYFVCEDNAWREATLTEEKNCIDNGVCLLYNCTAPKVGKFDNRDNVLYVCDLNQNNYTNAPKYDWRKANCAEKKLKSLCTANDSSVVWACEEDDGSKTNYICSKQEQYNGTSYSYILWWHAVQTPLEYKLEDWNKKKESMYNNPDAVYGEDLIDQRDGNVYKTVILSGKRWMAENLRYKDEVNTKNLKTNISCYANEDKNCEIAGVYYTWTAAMDIDSKWSNGSAPSTLTAYPHQGVCPNGWHIPTWEEWEAIKIYDYDRPITALDTNGFSALRVNSISHGNSSYGNFVACYWSSDHSGCCYALGKPTCAVDVSIRCLENYNQE